MDNTATISTAGKTRIFLVEDHAVFREGLTLLIENEPDLQVCGAAETVADAMAQIADLEPDVVVVDISLGQENGLDLIKRLHQYQAKLPVLALSMHDENVYAERALAAGARGYIMKNEAMDIVRQAIRRVLTGEIYVSEKMVSRMIHKLVHLRVPVTPSLVDMLSNREFDVFRMIAQGIGPTQIAQELGVSVKTIETHREHIKEKLGLKNGTELTRFALAWQTERR